MNEHSRSKDLTGRSLQIAQAMARRKWDVEYHSLQNRLLLDAAEKLCVGEKGKNMRTLVDLSTMQFGFLRVVSQAGFAKNRGAQWRCVCRCGREVTVPSYALTSGIKRSCGLCKKDSRLRAVFTEIK